MISSQEARTTILSNVSPLPPKELPFTETLGLVLAEDIVSDLDIPPFNNSSMDGFAVRAEDTASAASDSPVSLRISGEIPAGEGKEFSLMPGEALRIMTGAPMPPGADAVVPKENTETRETTVLINNEAQKGEYVRLIGEDVSKGLGVLKKGTTIRAPEIGLLASLGRSRVKVFRAPTVAVIGTGNELVEVNKPLLKGQIRDSNSYSLAAQINGCGAKSFRLGIAKDTREDTLAKISKGFEYDVVITIGGVSVGEYDFVNQVLKDLGAELKFWRIRQEPGKPLAFSVLKGKPVFGLPGNPVSAMVCFEEYVRPALLKMMGKTKLFRPEVSAVLDQDFKKEPGKIYFLRTKLERRNGTYFAKPTGPQGSGILRSMALADGIGIIPEESSLVKAGDKIRVQMIGLPEDH